MSTQKTYSAEEWQQIVNAPVMAGMLVITSDPAIFGSIKESAAVAKAINEFGQTSETELIREIGRSMSGENKPEMPDLPSKEGPDAVMKDLVKRCHAAALIVQEKSPDEADAFNNYLIDVAKRTAESSKEGGFLGIGAVRVSDQEKAAVKQLAAALGVEG
jgi:hypothetical protein